MAMWLHDFTHFKNSNHHAPHKGFGKLQSLGLSFDLQVNLRTVAVFLHPNTAECSESRA
jgi:hypothetical protein